MTDHLQAKPVTPQSQSALRQSPGRSRAMGKEVVGFIEAGNSLRAAAKEFEISHELARQVVIAAKGTQYFAERKARQQAEREAARDSLLPLRTRPCALCRATVHTSSDARIVTCGPRCQQAWRKLRRFVDPPSALRLRLSDARFVLRHPRQQNETAVARAARFVACFLAGQELPVHPERQQIRSSRPSFQLLADILGSPQAAEKRIISTRRAVAALARCYDEILVPTKEDAELLGRSAPALLQKIPAAPRRRRQ